MSADFWASYLSGALGILIGNRLDVLKVQAQAGLTFSPPTPPRSPLSSAASPTVTSPLLPSTNSTPRPSTSATTTTANSRLLYSRLTSHFRGAAAPIFGYGALNSILFVTFNRSLKYLEPGLFDYTKLAGCSLGNIWLAGALGGLATWIVSAPSEFVKCRAQLQVGAGGDSSWGVAKETVRRHGVTGLFRGGAVTSVRDAVGYGWYFWTYELCKRGLVGRREADWFAEMKAWEVLVAGGIAGVVTWASVYPLDVVKTRIQTAVIDDSGGKRMGVREAVREAWREGGLRTFYRGIGVCSLRAFVVNAVQWYAYEKIMVLLT